MSAASESRPVSRAGRAERPNAARQATPSRRAAPPPYERDCDEWRDERALHAEWERDEQAREAEHEDGYEVGATE